MRNPSSLPRLTLALTLIAGCAVSDPDESLETIATTEQALGSPTACFVDLGQFDPSQPLSRRFNSSCSTAPAGTFIQFRSWDFGDGTGGLSGTIKDHVFPFTNTCYKVRLTVFDSTGGSDDVSQNVTFCTVGPCNPVCPP